MILTPWFGATVVTGLVAALVVSSLFMVAWRTTPAGFEPEVRIRLLDYIQSRMLKRSAVRARAEGRAMDEYLAWAGAAANDAGDLGSLRGVLDAFGRLDRPETQIMKLRQPADWLLRLGGTNLVDVERITRAWLSCGMWERAARTLSPVADRLPADLEPHYLIALVEMGAGDTCRRWLETRPEWRDLVRATNAPAAVALRQRYPHLDVGLHLIAYQGAFGSPDEAAKSLQQIRQARVQKNLEDISYDLEMLIYRLQADADASLQLLRLLIERGRSVARHYLVCGELLVQQGRSAEASKLFDGAVLMPRDNIEAFRLGRLLTTLGMWDESQRLLQRYATTAGWGLDLLLLHSRVLMQKQQWDEVRSLALRLRLQPEISEYLFGYSFFLEGMADFHRCGTEYARETFTRLAEEGIPESKLAMLVAAALLEVHQADTAEAVLMPHRPANRKEPEFLALLIRCAERLKHDEYLGDAVSQLRQLRPQDLLAVHNYAASLLIMREKPEEALSLTRDTYAQLRTSSRAALTHAASLLQNQRLDEAEEVLSRLISERLDAEAMAEYEFLLFELQYRRQQWGMALATHGRIATERLYPAQRRWLAQTRDEIEQRLRRAPDKRGPLSSTRESGPTGDAGTNF